MAEANRRGARRQGPGPDHDVKTGPASHVPDEGRRVDRYRDAIEASPALVVGVAADGTVALVNPAVEAASGLPAVALLGRRFEDLLTPLSRPAGAAPGAPGERGLRTATGGERRVEWRFVPRDDITWAFGVDVTRARAEARRLRAVEQLAVVGELTSGIAHEVRNPLSSAMLELRLLARRLARSGDRVDVASVGTVRLELERVERLLGEFLWFARPLSATTQPGRLEAPAAAVARLVSAEAARRDVTITTDFDPGAAPVAFDEDCIRQAIFHLVRNALEAVPRGGHITMRVRAAGASTELDVEDDGPGIEGDPARVFVPFHSTGARGAALGLTIAQRIATDHGGEVTVRRASGPTVLTLSLPVLGPEGAG